MIKYQRPVGGMLLVGFPDGKISLAREGLGPGQGWIPPGLFRAGVPGGGPALLDGGHVGRRQVILPGDEDCIFKGFRIGVCQSLFP